MMQKKLYISLFSLSLLVPILSSELAIAGFGCSKPEYDAQTIGFLSALTKTNLGIYLVFLTFTCFVLMRLTKSIKKIRTKKHSRGLDDENLFFYRLCFLIFGFALIKILIDLTNKALFDTVYVNIDTAWSCTSTEYTLNTRGRLVVGFIVIYVFCFIALSLANLVKKYKHDNLAKK